MISRIISKNGKSFTTNFLRASQLTPTKKMMKDNNAKMVLDMILTYCTATDMPSLEKLVQVLPPGVIPLDWIMKFGHPMDPRFYSIAAISKTEQTVSIAQSIYSFKATGKAGVTSRWLRNLACGAQVTGTFATTDFHMPNDEQAPVIMISTGSGIAPFRSFWLAGKKNPLFLFYGCRDPDELPFALEIDQLEASRRMQSFIAFSRISKGKMRLDQKMKQERGILLKLLNNKRTTIYLCGSPELESTVRTALIMILAEGDDVYPGLGMVRAVEKLVIMQQTKRFIREVYGTGGSTDDPSVVFWQESIAKIVRNIAGIQRLGVPRARVDPELAELQERKSLRRRTSKSLRRKFIDF